MHEHTLGGRPSAARRSAQAVAQRGDGRRPPHCLQCSPLSPPSTYPSPLPRSSPSPPLLSPPPRLAMGDGFPSPLPPHTSTFPGRFPSFFRVVIQAIIRVIIRAIIRFVIRAIIRVVEYPGHYRLLSFPTPPEHISGGWVGGGGGHKTLHPTSP